ncbi:hypothetical protein [Campylobacter sp. 19-13652]|uniref:hypothetical protein n=1 Tax=Campylobacter sp. 19-13652 TaxID=2840180 RepID=UPI001C7411A3|nr:hypothetical protein [Campylobacter sp. 19-13652]BCX78799.1 hypothetical protein LBC_02610 [Campylobacter sp. 19-13652]
MKGRRLILEASKSLGRCVVDGLLRDSKAGLVLLGRNAVGPSKSERASTIEAGAAKTNAIKQALSDVYAVLPGWLAS